MPSIIKQFFATPDELFKLSANWMTEYKVQAVAMNYFPIFNYFLITTIDDLQKITHKFIVDRICFGTAKPNLDITSNHDFILKNPTWACLDVGKLKDNKLDESCFSGKMQVGAIPAVWEKMDLLLKKQTTAGLWTFNPKSKAKHFSRNQRFTAGAKALAESGIILQGLGTSQFSIEEPFK